MKQLLVLIFTFLTIGAFAQIKTPSASPKAKVEQTVGITDFTLEYSRPSMKGRTIFAADGLVPYGKVWRTGANAVTKLSASKDFKIEGKEMPAGDYAILTKPGASSWDVHFYNYDGWRWSSYTEKDPAGIVTVKPVKAPMVTESFMLFFDNLRDESATLKLMWADVIVPLKVETTDGADIVKQIDGVMAGPSNNDYYQAATYYHNAGLDMEKALMWINKATDVEEPAYWQVRRKALILKDMGRTKEAIMAATKSMELAKAAGNDDYVRMNEKSIKEWGM